MLIFFHLGGSSPRLANITFSSEFDTTSVRGYCQDVKFTSSDSGRSTRLLSYVM